MKVQNTDDTAYERRLCLARERMHGQVQTKALVYCRQIKRIKIEFIKNQQLLFADESCGRAQPNMQVDR